MGRVVYLWNAITEEVADYPSLIQITCPELKHEETMAS